MSLPLFKPLTEWPHPEADPTRSPFDAPLAATDELLNRELRAVDARYPFLSLVAGERAVRQDGRLRADAKVLYRGVILAFEQPGVGQVSYACDRYVRSYRGSGVDWQENLRAIALGMESLRRVERYGIADAGQQYQGFKALGAGIALGPAAMTIDEAARFLAEQACAARGEPNALNAADVLGDQGAYAYRTASKVLHPDAGGDPALFRRLTEARDLLAAR